MLKIIIGFLLLIVSNLSAKEWEKKHSVVEENINTLLCIDSTTCYAFADDIMKLTTRIYKSDDQGNTWDEIYSDYYWDGNDIWPVSLCQVIDTSLIFMTYSRKFVIDKSTDGGKTFKRLVFESPGRDLVGWLDDFKMYNKNIGVIAAPNEVFYTLDGWETYRVVVHDKYRLSGRPIFFIDSTNVGISKNRGFGSDIIQLKLETETFSPYYKADPPAPDEKEKTMWDVCFVNDSVGFACGGQKYQNAFADDIIWKTIDRGKNWDIIHHKRVPKSTILLKITFANELHGLAAAGGDKLVETTDGGDTWFYPEVPDEAIGTLSPELAICGSYNIVAFFNEGIYRYGVPTSINDKEFEDLDIHVHQTQQQLSISISDERYRSYSLQIVDMLGRTLHEEKVQTGLESIVDLSIFASGMYVYRILCDNAVAKTGKILVKR